MNAAHGDPLQAGVVTLATLERLLGLTSSHGSLATVLDEVLRFAEHLTPDMRCSILLADLGAGVLRHGAAPSLPSSYTAAIDPLPIAEGAGSCGTAAARREWVIVSEIDQSPLWCNFRQLARDHGLAACWSVPLIDDAGWLLGTCAMYYGEARAPSAAERELVRVTGGLCTLIIQRRRDARELRSAREDLQAILDNVPARVTQWDATCTNRFANRSAVSQFGGDPAAIRGRNVREVIGEERYRRAKPYIEAALAGNPQPHEQIDPLPDGTSRHSFVEYIPKRHDGQIVGLYVVATDVTELRNSYERIRELAQRLETVREDERHAVAQELHEGIAQELFAMKLGLDHLLTASENRPGATQAIEEFSAAIDGCISATRQIANDLKPSALTHLPIAVALKDYALQFGHLSGLNIRVTEIAPFDRLDETTSLIFFRAAQEALTNVVRHAHATVVHLVLRADGKSATLDITDDGIGIDEDALSKEGSLGLLGLRERVVRLGGALVIRRHEGSGTTVSVHLPTVSGSVR